jgi:hypothetical protein
MKKIITILFVGVFFLVPAISWSAPPFDLISALQSLEARVAELEATVGQLGDLADYITIETVDGIPRIIFHDVNVQIVSGAGDTYTINGKGNLIIGYDAESTSITEVCSDGQYNNQTDCEDNGEVWDSSHKSGSHIIVVGDEHNYSRAGGFVAGLRNTINRNNATVTGGQENTASGENSSVSGGEEHIASGQNSIVAGGYQNFATGRNSSVSGGVNNTASGDESSVTGGALNTASEVASSISGGFQNSASGRFSGVSGGIQNVASGIYSTVSGGSQWTASGSEEHLP